MEVSSFVDYDADSDGLIEVRTLAQLDVIRYDLDGDGAVSSAAEAAYGAAFPSVSGGSDYGAVLCSGDCVGYELLNDLDFEDANSDGTSDDKSVWAQGAVSAGIPGAVVGGWVPIGSDRPDSGGSYQVTL